MLPQGPLKGIRVIDLADISGATCGKLLASLGADTLLLEPPGGSSMRATGPFAGDRTHPDRSLPFWFYSVGKTSACLDLDDPADRNRLRELASTADILIESFAPGYLDKLAIGPRALRAINPALVVVSITPFGQEGPQADWRGSDLVCQAMGGMVAVNGPADAAPLPGVGLPAYHNAGIHAASAALAALLARRHSGCGDWIDVSIQASAAAAVEHATSLLLANEPSVGRRGPLHWSRDFRIGPSADGHVVHSALGDWTTLLEWMKAEGDAADLTDPRWSDLDYRRTHWEHFFAVLDGWSSRHPGEELAAAAQLRRLPIAPVRRPEQLAVDPHLKERQSFWRVRHDELHLEVLYPGSPFRFSVTPCGPPARPPVATLGRPTPVDRAAPLATAPRNPPDKAPLDGIRVIDFTWVVAGPLATRLLADFGAEVIKIERLDAPRGPVRQQGLFGNLNRGKRSLAIDLNTTEGLQLVRRLISTADVVIDNFSTRVMANFGLSPEALAALHPEIITVGLSGFGASGPYRDFVSYGPTLQALSGHTWLMRTPEDALPMGWGFSYSDMVAGGSSVLAVLAALWQRQSSGRGQHVDVSQFECLIASLGPALLASLNPHLRASDAATAREAFVSEAPDAIEAIVRCADRHGEQTRRHRWCAIAIFSDADWQRCRSALGDPAWCGDPRFASQAERSRHRAALLAGLESWTVQHSAEQVMQKLQAHGVAAGNVAEADDLIHSDVQLRARGYWRVVTDRDNRQYTVDGLPVHFSSTPLAIERAAPPLGDDTHEILGNRLGLSSAQIEALRERRIIANERPRG